MMIIRQCSVVVSKSQGRSGAGTLKIIFICGSDQENAHAGLMIIRHLKFLDSLLKIKELPEERTELPE